MGPQPGKVEQGGKPSWRSRWMAPAVIMVVAAGLRYLGIQWGLPNELHLFSYHPDEFHSLRGVFSLIMGDLNPHFFNYGSLYLYLVGFSCLLLSGGQLAVSGFEQLPRLLPTWTLVGREVSLVAAVLTVLAVYALARTIAGHRQGLVAAALCAVFPLHVLHSRYATVDVTQALMTTLALLLAVRIYQDPRRRNYVLAGLAVGLAASAKYNGALVLVGPICAHLLALRQPDGPAPPARCLWWLVVMAAVGFLLTSPYTVMDWANAKHDIIYEIQHMRDGEWPAREADPSGHWFHVVHLTMTTLGATIFALFGAWALLRDRRYRNPTLILVLFAVLWLLMIGSSGVRYGRYVMPIVPVVAVLAAASPLLVWRNKAELKLAAVLAIGALLGANAYHSALLSYEMMQPDDRDRTLWLLAEYVPQTETVGTVWEPWFQGPPLDYVNGGAILRQNRLWQTFSRQVRPHITVGQDADALGDTLPYAVVYSNFEVRDALRIEHGPTLEWMQVLSEEYRLVWYKPTRAPLAGILGWVPPQDWLYPFPELTLWVRRQPQAQTSDS